MQLGKWRNHDAPIRIARKNKQDFERALNELIMRGYVVVWRHETLNFAKLKRE